MGVAILMMVIGRVLTKIWPEIGIFIMAAGNLHMNGFKKVAQGCKGYTPPNFDQGGLKLMKQQKRIVWTLIHGPAS